MKEVIEKRIYLSADEILKKFGIKGDLVSFDIPTRGEFSSSSLHDKHLLVVVKSGDVD